MSNTGTFRADLSRLIHPEEPEKYNCRKKYVIDISGECRLIQTMVADEPIFCSSGSSVERMKRKKEPEKLQKEKEAILSVMVENMSSALDDRLTQAENENIKSASYRARRKVFDYAIANYDFEYFITLTLNGEYFQRNDIETACKKLNKFLANRVQRKGLKYIIVPELHKDGAIHFHGLINKAVEMVPSGTYIPPNGGKPLKGETLKRKGVPLEDCREVFNIVDWKYGFTTAIKIDEERERTARYVAKYITKESGNNGKICGRYYFSGGDLLQPFFTYEQADFEACEGFLVDTRYLRAKIF